MNTFRWAQWPQTIKLLEFVIPATSRTMRLRGRGEQKKLPKYFAQPLRTEIHLFRFRAVPTVYDTLYSIQECLATCYLMAWTIVNGHQTTIVDTGRPLSGTEIQSYHFAHSPLLTRRVEFVNMRIRGNLGDNAPWNGQNCPLFHCHKAQIAADISKLFQLGAKSWKVHKFMQGRGMSWVI